MRKEIPITEFASLVGQEVGVSDWATITQEQINTFGETTGDTQWIHCDPVKAAAESPFKTTIAHGFLTLSLVPGLIERTIGFAGTPMALNYGLNKVRFVSPVPVDSKVRCRIAVAEVKPFAQGIDVVFNCTVEREGSDKPACVAEWIARFLAA